MCVDFCNSGQGARGGAAEWIAGYGQLVDWLHSAAAVTAGQAARLRRAGVASPRAAAGEWRRAIGFREVLFRVLNTRAEGSAAGGEDIARIEAEYLRTAPFARLRWTGESYAWSLEESPTGTDAAIQPLVASAISLLASHRLAQLRRCGNSTCYWLFIDETRNHSRRWCEMASCGNLVKVRRHRERMRVAAQ